ncbi:MAG TPA: hypothetical protein VFN61_12550 [Acidimicrobiales bacterium]|nr:hypothetical protein [Acidimicrobiales bacterium]
MMLHLRKLASAPEPDEAEALLLAVRIALGQRAPSVAVPAPAWRFAGRRWPLRAPGTPAGGLPSPGFRPTE